MYKEGDLVYHKTWFTRSMQVHTQLKLRVIFTYPTQMQGNWDTQAQWQCFSKISDDDKALAEEFATIS